jgi:hypothetical protein
MSTRAECRRAVSLSPDRPIATRPEDFYGHDPSARTIAEAIALPRPRWTGLRPAWTVGFRQERGVNLVRHHLKDREDARDLALIDFNPWRRTDKHAVAFSFYRELAVDLGGSLGARAKALLGRIGRNTGGHGRLVGAGMNVASEPPRVCRRLLSRREPHEQRRRTSPPLRCARYPDPDRPARGRGRDRVDAVPGAAGFPPDHTARGRETAPTSRPPPTTSESPLNPRPLIFNLAPLGAARLHRRRRRAPAPTPAATPRR